MTLTPAVRVWIGCVAFLALVKLVFVAAPGLFYGDSRMALFDWPVDRDHRPRRPRRRPPRPAHRIPRAVAPAIRRAAPRADRDRCGVRRARGAARPGWGRDEDLPGRIRPAPIQHAASGVARLLSGRRDLRRGGLPAPADPAAALARLERRFARPLARADLPGARRVDLRDRALEPGDLGPSARRAPVRGPVRPWLRDQLRAGGVLPPFRLPRVDRRAARLLRGVAHPLRRPHLPLLADTCAATRTGIPTLAS